MCIQSWQQIVRIISCPWIGPAGLSKISFPGAVLVVESCFPCSNLHDTVLYLGNSPNCLANLDRTAILWTVNSTVKINLLFTNVLHKHSGKRFAFWGFSPDFYTLFQSYNIAVWWPNVEKWEWGELRVNFLLAWLSHRFNIHFSRSIQLGYNLLRYSL